VTLVPEGAWDCHAHAIEDPRRYPLASARGYEPPIAPLESYLDLLDRYGFAHGVLVQPSVYGFDNRCLLDALDRADGRLYGIAVPPPETLPRELEAMHRRGVRGVRCNLLYPGGLSLEVAESWLPALRALGWHTELHVNIENVSLPAILARFDVPVVVDHMGRPLHSGTDLRGTPSGQLIECVRQGACYVKLSAPYRLSDGAAPWSDVTLLARALVAANPGACLWASDWPHTDTAAAVTMESLLSAMADWCPDPATRRIILAETPKSLFRPF
jgi:predicted TIM-barrel fold metal-dependent hydrolase